MICLISKITLNCVLAFSISEYLLLFFFTLHDDLTFSFSIMPILTIGIRANQFVATYPLPLYCQNFTTTKYIGDNPHMNQRETNVCMYHVSFTCVARITLHFTFKSQMFASCIHKDLKEEEFSKSFLWKQEYKQTS